MPPIRYCLNGHWENNDEPIFMIHTPSGFASQQRWNAEETLRQRLVKFCEKCGAGLIDTCPSCEHPLKFASDGSNAPSYCGGCGKPFPWTEIALRSASEFTDEIEELSIADKLVLKDTFPLLVTDTPRTSLAASRFKRIVGKLAHPTQEVLTKIIVDVVTQAAKNGMGIGS